MTTPAAAFKAILVYEYGLAPADLATAHSFISIRRETGALRVDNALAVFDTVMGGLRLSGPLFSDLHNILSRLKEGVSLAGHEALIGELALSRLREWSVTLELSVPQARAPQLTDDRRRSSLPEAAYS